MTLETHPLWGTFSALVQEGAEHGQSPIVALTSPFTRSGTSHVARDLAKLAAAHYAMENGRVALIDFDIHAQTQALSFRGPHESLHGPFDATFGETPFWQVSQADNAALAVRPHPYCELYFVGETGLAVSKFNWDNVKTGQSVTLQAAPDYWAASKSQFSMIIVDCPAFDRSEAGLLMIPDADATVLVSPAHRASEAEHTELSQKINAAGGKCTGMILNSGLPIQEYSALQA